MELQQDQLLTYDFKQLQKWKPPLGQHALITAVIDLLH